MKALLLFPPSWHPSQPYLSLPSLTAFLKQNGVSDVAQRDLNIELLDALLTRKECSAFYQRIVDKIKSMDRTPVHTPQYQEQYHILAEAAEAIPAILDRVEAAKNTLRSEAFYDPERYMEGVHIVNEALRNMSALYYPSLMTPVSNTMRYSVYSSQDVFQALDDEDENIFLGLYQRHVLSSVLEYAADMLGISITYTSNIIPG